MRYFFLNFAVNGVISFQRILCIHFRFYKVLLKIESIVLNYRWNFVRFPVLIEDVPSTLWITFIFISNLAVFSVNTSKRVERNASVFFGNTQKQP